jgi:hypothetical protein
MHHLSNRNLSRWRFQPLSLTLVALLVYAPSASAQLPAASPDQIELRIVSGSGAEFQPGSQQKQRLVMQVVNQDERPLAGVAVTFQLPDDGPSGLFGNGQRSIVAFTNDEGEASITGVKWNNTSGPVSIRVTAVKGMAHAGTLLPVRLTAASGKPPAPGAEAALQSDSPKKGPMPAAAPAGQPQAAQPAAHSPHTAIAPSVDIQPGTLPAQSASVAPREASERPAVTISGAPQGHSGLSNKKWLVIAVVAAGVAVGVTMVLLKKSGSSSSSSTANDNPLSIGSPAVSVGQP